MRTTAGVLLLFAVCLWLEESVLPFLLPGGVSLRLVTLFIIGVAIHHGPIVGGLTGFCAGVAVSLAAGEPLGVASFALVCVGWTGGAAALRIHVSAWTVRIILVFGLLALEAAATFAAAWIVFGVAYRFNFWGIAAAAMLSPLALRVAEPVIGREDIVARYA